MTRWIQHRITLTPRCRGFHLITREIVAAIPELPGISAGLLHVFLQHTSASLVINENADPDVPVDLESSLNAIVPESFNYQHTIEGPDDMPAHVKVALLGSSVSVPIGRGHLLLGTWQGIYLCEHRDRAAARHLILTVQGASPASDKS